jgi:hypothetical protein
VDRRTLPSVRGTLVFWRVDPSGSGVAGAMPLPLDEGGVACENWVAGEWFRCHKHNTVRYYKHHGGHWVDPQIPRWKIGDYSRGLLVDRPVEGVGFISVRPVNHALLYRKGYARRPSDVILAVPQYIRDGYRRIASMRLRSPAQPDSTTLILGKQGVRNATAENLKSVVGATQLALATFTFAVVVSLIAMFLPVPQQSYMQWMGTLGFVCAWCSLSAGIWQRREDWLGGSLWKTLKWWLTIFAPVAIANLLLSPPAS